MKIAIEGCAHGELEVIYDSIKHLEIKENIKIDLLICCGDFQASRNLQDLESMAVPPKYQSMCSFYKYYSGEKTAPVLTLFIGGNHEASNHLQELPYGGWAAPNIYYMGYANVLNIAGIRVAGISGIYKGHDYMKGRFEKPPYSNDTKRSVYHIRNLEVFRLKQISQPVDIFLSHDWPRGIHQFGDEYYLLKQKPFFSKDISDNALGSKPCEELLHHLKPVYWFAAHLHVKFAALVPHELECGKKKITKFLALDKCLPKRKFLQIIDVPHDANKEIDLEYDHEWLTILYLTNHLLSVNKCLNYLPGPGSNERWVFSPTQEEFELVRQKFKNNFEVPKNFIMTAKPYNGEQDDSNRRRNNDPSFELNPQTVLFCEQLGIDDPMVLLLKNSNESLSISSSFSSYNSPYSLTPQKSRDVSFISFNDSSEYGELEVTPDVNLSPLQSSTPVGSVNTSSSASLRKSLILPSPLNCDDEETSKPVKDETGETSKPVKDETGENESISQESDTDNINSSCDDGLLSTSEHTDVCSQQETEETSQPKVKKFRRRNEALYSSVDED